MVKVRFLSSFRSKMPFQKYEPILHQFDSYQHLRELKNYINSDSTLDDLVNYPYGRISENCGFVAVAAMFHSIFSALDFTSSIKGTKKEL